MFLDDILMNIMIDNGQIWCKLSAFSNCWLEGGDIIQYSEII